MNRYKYSSLMEINKDNFKYNFYGLIYDATFPTYDHSPTQFVCKIKVIDNIINRPQYLSNFDQEVITLVFKSSSRENLPFAHHIGDIIRVHRGMLVTILKLSFY